MNPIPASQDLKTRMEARHERLRAISGRLIDHLDSQTAPETPLDAFRLLRATEVADRVAVAVHVERGQRLHLETQRERLRVVADRHIDWLDAHTLSQTLALPEAPLETFRALRIGEVAGRLVTRLYTPVEELKTRSRRARKLAMAKRFVDVDQFDPNAPDAEDPDDDGDEGEFSFLEGEDFKGFAWSKLCWEFKVDRENPPGPEQFTPEAEKSREDVTFIRRRVDTLKNFTARLASQGKTLEGYLAWKAEQEARWIPSEGRYADAPASPFAPRTTTEPPP